MSSELDDVRRLDRIEQMIGILRREMDRVNEFIRRTIIDARCKRLRSLRSRRNGPTETRSGSSPS